MPVVGVDAARPDQADQVEPATGPRGPRRRRRRGPAGSKNEPSAIAASIRGRSWRTGRPAPEVQVPDLRVAHLAGRQADGLLGGPERWRAATARAGRARSASGPRRWRRRAGRCPMPEPVEDHEDDRRGRVAVARGRVRPSPVGVAVGARAAAVSPARATIPAISSGLSEAPPTRAPSIEGSARNSAMLADGHAAAVQDRDVRSAAAAPAEAAQRPAGSPRPSPPHPSRWRCGRSRSPRPARRR